MKNELLQLKNILYDMIEEIPEEKDSVALDQKMGVSVTRAVQREGNITVIQNANVYVFQIARMVVKGLKLVDCLLAKENSLPSMALLAAPAQEKIAEEDPLTNFLIECYGKGFGIKDITELIHRKYFEFIFNKQDGKVSEIAKDLRVGNAQIYYLIRKFTKGEQNG